MYLNHRPQSYGNVGRGFTMVFVTPIGPNGLSCVPRLIGLLCCSWSHPTCACKRHIQARCLQMCQYGTHLWTNFRWPRSHAYQLGRASAGTHVHTRTHAHMIIHVFRRRPGSNKPWPNKTLSVYEEGTAPDRKLACRYWLADYPITLGLHFSMNLVVTDRRICQYYHWQFMSKWCYPKTTGNI